MDNQSVVYVVDDDAAVRKSLERLIRSVGLVVETFPSARDFLVYDLPDRPGCLLLDIEMPEITGLDLQVQLAALNQSLPIIFLTGLGSIPRSVQAMKAGAVDFLEKPCVPETLLKAIEQAINHDKQGRQTTSELTAIQKLLESLSVRELEVFELVVTGMLNKIKVPTNEPNTTPSCKTSKAAAAMRNTGPATKGTTPRLNAPQANIENNVRGPGDLSAQKPPKP